VSRNSIARVLGCALVLLAAGRGPLAAQNWCDFGFVDPAVAARCLAVAQAAESAQPRLGVLISGGNPVIGTTGGGGLRLGVVPRVDLSAGVRAVSVRIPDIRQGRDQESELMLAAPSLYASGSLGVFPGVRLAPGLGGLGSVDLLASAAWLPFSALDTDGFDEHSTDLAWGAGVRIGILRESFVAPGVAVSVMRHSLGRVGFGDTCRGLETAFPMTRDTECAGEGDPGEFSFDLTGWSTRAVVGKRLLGFGLLGGIGYDRYASDVEYAFRVDVPGEAAAYIRRPEPVDLRSDRWAVFANASYTLLLASLSLEAGWQQGGSPISAFGERGSFDPRGGAWFGGAGVRLSF
jgi:hypothetical protein